MLGQLTGQDQANRGLDLSRRDGRLLVVRGQLGGFGRDTLKDVWIHMLEKGSISYASRMDEGALTVDERVQDRHGTVGDTGVGMNLLED